jgi:predicted HTH domain antitoxin
VSSCNANALSGVPRALSQLFQSLDHCVRDVADDQRSHGFLLRAFVKPELVLWAMMATECRNSMQAFSVRQLKSNPSTVLRAAEADAMAVVTSHQEPTALVVALDRLGLPDTAAVRSGLALSLFQAGSLSVGSAARIAGMPLPRFLKILASLRIPVADASDADLNDELEQARRWLGQGS